MANVLWLFPVLSLLTAAPARPPKAVPKPAELTDAKKAFDLAQTLFKEGKFEAALATFQRVQELKSHPVLFFNIGRCYEKLNQPSKALANYRIYLLRMPDAVDREDVLRALPALERALKKNNQQQLMVTADPDDATVSIDGVALGHPPAFADLGPGDHRVVIEREGLQTISRSFVMSTNKSLELTFTMQPMPSQPVAEVLPPPPPPPPSTVVAGAPGASGPGAGPPRWVPLVVAGGGLGVGVVGGVFLGLAAKDRADLTRAGALSGLYYADAQAKVAAVNRNDTLGLSLAIGGGALLAAGVVWYFVAPKAPVSVTLLPGAGSAALVLGGAL